MGEWYKDKAEHQRRWEASGYNPGLLSAEGGTSPSTLLRWRKRLGINPVHVPKQPLPFVHVERELPEHQDRDTFEEVWRRFDGDRYKIASEFGISYPMVAYWLKRHSLPAKPSTVGELSARLHTALLKHPEASVSALADLLDVSPARVRRAVGDLSARGFRIEAPADDDTNPTVTLETGKQEPSHIDYRLEFEGNTYRFAVVSDVHLGSKHEALPELEAAYDVIESLGIKDVFNPGDLVAGIGVYGERQRIHIHKQTFEEQVEYAAEQYPSRPGITTSIIAGNHDLEGNFGKIGANPVRAVCEQREDMTYLGEYSAFITLPNGARIHLLHPMGGSSYAKSYRPQKLVESYEGGTKPNMLIIGHWHGALAMPIRGVWTMLAGCFERQNELGVRKGLGEPAVGFWVVEVALAPDGSLPRIKTEWYSFFRGRLVGEG